MKKNLFFTTLLMLSVGFLSAQILSEDFEGGSLPTGWTIQTNATDGGWQIATAGALSSQFWDIADNGSTRIAGTNDDNCNCDKSADYLVTPALDFTSVQGAILKFEAFFGEGNYQGADESANVEVSLDGTNWTSIYSISGGSGWQNHAVDLSQYGGEEMVHIGFRYNDGGGWLFGIAIDNVIVEEPAQLDAELSEINSLPFGEEMTEVPISGTISNNGLNEITSLEVVYTVDGGSPIIGNLNGLSIPSLATFDFEHPFPWMPDAPGTYTINVAITAVNGITDDNLDNNTIEFETEIFPLVVRPNRIQEYLETFPNLIEIANSGDQLDRPTDLDFFPILSRNELWVINQRTENAGGSTLTFFDAGTAQQTTWQRVDGNAWHFMSLPTAMEFGNNFNWASAPGVQDANHGGGSFTGPTLWSSDPDIYAQPSGGNGSHLDMLHGSPFSMGIAHEIDNVYWINDTWNEEIVRYDFVDDHGPGNDYHGDALVRRYQEVKTKRDGDVPSHMILDKTTGWLYIVDNGNDRVMRLDINSGNVTNNLPLINEPLTEHSRVGNVTWEVIIEDGLDRPCGIEIMENRLLVSDYATGEIIVYDVDNNFEELGRIQTEAPGITGIKIGPQGYIWYTNRTQNTLTRVEPGDPNSVEEELWEASIRVFPNPTSGMTTVSLPEIGLNPELSLEITDLMGKNLWNGKAQSNTIQIDLREYATGMYLLKISNGEFVATKRIVLDK